VNQFGAKPGLVKLYLRIGEVAELVGVQPHVLRYWEMEFRGAIRPQKSKKGQRVYSRQDVERLLKVKDLLRNQGFTIAGARKVLREGVSAKLEGAKGDASPAVSQASAAQASAVQTSAAPSGAVQSSAPAQAPLGQAMPEISRTVTPLRPVALAPTPAVAPMPAVVWAASEAVPSQERLSPAAEQPVAAEIQTLTLSAPKSEVVAVAERAPMFELVLPSAANSDRSAKRLRRALVDLRQDVVSALKELS
jgi:DNA-binding transcriptional MerR regulator